MAPDHSSHYLLLLGYVFVVAIYVLRRFGAKRWLRPLTGIVLAGALLMGHLGAHNPLLDTGGHDHHAQAHPCCLFQVPTSTMTPGGAEMVATVEFIHSEPSLAPERGYEGALTGRSPPDSSQFLS